MNLSADKQPFLYLRAKISQNMRPALLSLGLVAAALGFNQYRLAPEPEAISPAYSDPDIALSAVTSAIGMNLVGMASLSSDMAGFIDRFDTGELLLEVITQYRSSQDAEVLAKAVSHATGHSVDKVLVAMPDIEKSADRHGVPASLLAALIHRESSFDPKARSSAGAVGLSQIMPAYWSSVCDDLHSVEGNVDCGARVLAEYYEQAGDWDRALAYYNVGPSNYQKSSKLRGIGHHYASRVLSSKRGIDRHLAMITSQ